MRQILIPTVFSGKILHYTKCEMDMYTGIVRALGTIIELKKGIKHLSYCISCPDDFLVDVEIGASINIDGACQTVVRTDGNLVWFDAIEETLTKTTLKHAQCNTQVHLERSAKFGDEIGGHTLSGHVMDTAFISKKQNTSENTCTLTITCSKNIMRYIFPKGYIAIDGASLTIADVHASSFDVHLIPQTLKMTHFGNKQVNDEVNIEIDSQTQAMVLTAQRWMEHHYAEENA